MSHFEEISRQRVGDISLADKLHKSTGTSLTKTQHLIDTMPHWQALRQHARQIKLHTLSHLDQYLRQFVDAATRNRIDVSWAATGQDACRQVIDLAAKYGVRRATKAKSMTTEEIHLNTALEDAGIEPVETDFGEMICQLAEVAPSHVTAPIIQWSIEEVARLLVKKEIIREIPPELLGNASKEQRMAAAAKLVAAARRALREKFMSADMGISSANFAIAESGSIVLVENEANIRMSITLPDVHAAIVGIDKFIPRLADLGTFLTLLPVAATGQRQTSYVSILNRPFKHLHVILLDNGRSKLLADPEHFDLLSCIRCGACMNVCPVYRQVSGHGYESIYPGPIGAVLTPHLSPDEKFRELPFVSSLCGACTEICPVGIPLHERLLQWRERVTGSGERSRLEAGAFGAWAWLMEHPGVYRAARPPAGWIRAMAGMFGPAKNWSKTRVLPDPAEETFATWWKKNHD
jgi:L-lactate dehydrogenase complex protein LldF